MRREYVQKIRDYLVSHPCVDCGEKDPLVLDFDHVRGAKKDNISRMIRHIYAWSTIEAEIAKCEIRCANCHRRRTAVQQGWHSWLASVAELEEAPAF